MSKLQMIHHYYNLRTALFWVITQRVVAVTDVTGQPIGPNFRGGFVTLGDGTYRLSRNVGNKLPLLVT